MRTRKVRSSRVLLFVTLAASPTPAATIVMTPADNYGKIESAKAGDEVVVDPGTYRFRVYLTTAAPATAPIVIRGKDPQNPPIWDLGASNVEDAPGSYTAGDRGRGCWQFSGATNIQLSDIIITGCHNATHNSAGIRYYNTSTGIRLTNVVFHDNDNGLTGGTQGSELTAEFCEFNQNGTLQASSSAPSHNIYIYGGTFSLRYSYVHDPVQAQNFHIRAKESTIEYNWFARAKSYAGDLMTDDDNDGSQASVQNMTFRGNVIVQGSNQSNTSQIIAVYNDAGVSSLTLNVTLLYNTLVGNGGHPALVHLSNADGTLMNATLYDNIISGTTTPTLVEDSSHAMVRGSNNWLVTGATATGLTGSVFGSDPSFKNAAQSDFTLAPASQAIGKALTSVSGLPTSEYYRDESVKCMYRTRATANDIGAFESTTQGTGVGPHGNPPGSGGTPSSGGTSGSAGGHASGALSTGGAAGVGGTSTADTANGGNTTAVTNTATSTGGSVTNGGDSSAVAGASNPGTNTEGSCGCRMSGHRPRVASMILASVLALFAGSRSRKARRVATSR